MRAPRPDLMWTREARSTTELRQILPAADLAQRVIVMPAGEWCRIGKGDATNSWRFYMRRRGLKL